MNGDDAGELSERLLLDGGLRPDEAGRLAAALRRDPAAVAAAMLFACLLGQALDDDAEATVRGIEARLAADADASAMVRAVHDRLGQRPRRSRWLVAATLAAAAGLLAAIILAWPSSTGHRLEGGGRLRPGDAIVADADPATVRLAGGGRLVAMPGTRLVALAEPPAAGFRLDRGRIEAEVAPRPADRPLTIATPEAVATVVGTRFVLEAGPDGTRLAVAAGAVRLAGAGLDTVIDAGDSGAIPAGRGWEPLFPNGLADWHQVQGAWSATAGTVRGDAGGVRFARLEGGDLDRFELACRIRVGGPVDRGEVQIGYYNWFFTIPAGAWHDLRIATEGDRPTGRLDGRPVAAEAGDGQAHRPGPLGFYVLVGGTIEVANALVRRR